ncbi:helix-turn-helix domain-containing protein [Mesorhizobium sp. 2RAF21]|uniref:helix-turn-helix domain-containing protein n=1 Tax=Mesorhizobium sp. 2RAF21 TaxID=3232995 RepID=UPI003F999127
MTTIDVGGLIRKARKEKRLTLQDISKKSGISVPQLSKAENGKARLTVDLTLLIAEALDIPVGSILSATKPASQTRRSITRANGGSVYERNGMRFEALCDDLLDQHSAFWRVELTARTFEENGGWHDHVGEEFIHVISGKLELHTIHYEPAILNAGDSIIFDGEMRHAYVAHGETPAVMLMSNSLTTSA